MFPLKFKIAIIFCISILLTNYILYLFELELSIIPQLSYLSLFFLFFPKEALIRQSDFKYFNSNSVYIYIRNTYVIIGLISIIFILCHKGLNISSFIVRSRDFREDLFSSNIPIYIRYFILFSSSILPFFLGCVTVIIKKLKLFFYGLLSFFLLDGITDSRSSILAYIVGVSCMYIIFNKISIKSTLIIFITFILSFFFVFIGQGFDAEIFALRGLSYFTVPPLISNVLYFKSTPLFLGSFAEIFLWPIYAVLNYYPFDTSYEFEFVQLQTGLPGNVLIPTYACFNNIIDTSLVLVLFLMYGFVSRFFVSNNSVLSFLIYFTLFGPMSFLLNPFLAEKGFFVFIVFIVVFRKKITSGSYNNLKSCVEY